MGYGSQKESTDFKGKFYPNRISAYIDIYEPALFTTQPSPLSDVITGILLKHYVAEKRSDSLIDHIIIPFMNQQGSFVGETRTEDELMRNFLTISSTLLQENLE